MPTPLTPSAYRLYRALLVAGGGVLLAFGVLFGAPGAAAGSELARFALGLSALGLAVLLSASHWVRERTMAFVYTFFVAASAWQIWLAYADALSATSCLGVVLVFFGCSAGLQTPRWLAAYSVTFVAAVAAVGVFVEAPQVPPVLFVATLGALAALGTFVLRSRIDMIEGLEAARLDALAAARAKSEFLATMSHEIRTPMNGVLGMTELLARTPLSAEQAEYLHAARASGDALLGIINNVLDVSKLEAGKLDAELAPTDVREVLDDAAAAVAAQAARAGLELVTRVRPDVPATVLTDGPRLRQILLNLLSNAVKFTPAGEVVATLSLDGPLDADGAGALSVHVRDTGIGIPPDELDTVFQAFTQVDGSATRRVGGTGLGLTVSKRLADLLGGELWAESTPGHGSLFCLHLPFAASAPRPEPGRALATVLLVDAHPEALAALDDHVVATGFASLAVSDAAEALAWFDGGGRCDAALLAADLVAGGHGAHLLAALRLRGVPVALLAAPGAALPTPASDLPVLAKPARARAVDALVRRLLDGTATPAASPAPPPAAAAGLRVLLAEDHETNRRVALGLLRHLGVEADVAVDGAEAVAACAARDYDVVLMDLQMPRLDGLDATRRIRARPGHQPRVVALTANALPGDAARTRQAGMDAYLAKPVAVEALAQALGLAAPADPLRPPPPPAAPAPGSAVSPAMVLAAIRRLCSDDDPVLAAEVLDAYLGSDAALIDELATAARRGDDTALRGAAHKLKASSRTLGAPALGDRCQAAESGDLSPDAVLALADDLRAFRRTVAEARARLAADAPARTASRS